MKPVSIKTQKIIMFIPYINILNIPIHYYNCYQLNIPHSGFPRTLYVAFANALPILILGTIIGNVFELSGLAASVLSNAMAYFAPLLIGRGLIQYQQELIDEQKSLGDKQ